MTAAPRSRSATITGRTLTIAGTLVVLAWFALLAVAYTGDYGSQHTMTAGPGYLNGGPRDRAGQCTITATVGEQRRITVPAMPRRGVHLAGTRIDPWWTGDATITCDQATHFTQGFLARLLPLAGQWLLLLLGLILAGIGLHRLRLFRHTSRYP